MKNMKFPVDIDLQLVFNFLCTHRLDSTTVDFGSCIMEEDLIFYPVKNVEGAKQFHPRNRDLYQERISALFNPERNQN